MFGLGWIVIRPLWGAGGMMARDSSTLLLVRRKRQRKIGEGSRPADDAGARLSWIGEDFGCHGWVPSFGKFFRGPALLAKFPFPPFFTGQLGRVFAMCSDSQAIDIPDFRL